MADDGARYFGPFHSASAIRRTLHLVNKHFLLRTCTDHVLHNRVRPCLQFQIHRCLGPCVFPIDEGLYGQQVRDVVAFLEGKGEELVKDLRRRMGDAAQGLSFELAAVYRDQIDALTRSLEKQNVVSARFADRDVFGMARAAGTVCLQVLQIRQGRLAEADAFHFDRVELPDEEVVASLVAQYYGGTRKEAGIPPEVLVPALPAEAEVRRCAPGWPSSAAGAWSWRCRRAGSGAGWSSWPRRTPSTRSPSGWAAPRRGWRRSSASRRGSICRRSRGASSASTSPRSAAPARSGRWRSSPTARSTAARTGASW
jgi:hypothetical protein